MKLITLITFLLSFNALAQMITLRPGETRSIHNGNGGYIQVSCQGNYNPNPNPYPNPYPGNNNSYYLNMPNDQLLYVATTQGVGSCKIQDSRSCYNCACPYYVKANGQGFPQGTGCADSSTEAVNEFRKALQWNVCN